MITHLYIYICACSPSPVEASTTTKSRRTSAAAADPLRGHPRDHWALFGWCDGDVMVIWWGYIWPSGWYTVNNGLYMVIIWLMMVNNNLVIWLWLTVRHGFSMAHRKRWFTELNNGDFPVRYGTNNQLVYIYIYIIIYSTGWWCNNHLEKYESQWEGLYHILWKKMFQTTNQMT